MPKSFETCNARCELSPRALDMWNTSIRAASDDAENTITIYDVIGYDWWTGEGVTVKRIDAALRAIGDKPVTVYINSPGGDMFEGLAIYNRLRQHSKPITVKILGLAASAASIIAMAGNERLIASSSFIMIHNCWVMAVGNRHDLTDAAVQMAEFDAAMADVYAEASDLKVDEISALMDAESYIRGSRAVEQGFATGLLKEETRHVSDESASAKAARKLDTALAKTGMPRSERRKLLTDYKTSTQNAAGGDTPGAILPDTQNAVVQPDLAASLSAANSIIAQLGGHHG